MTTEPAQQPYLIIGSGAAGIAAAETIREADPHRPIIVLGREPEGYYSRPGLAYYLSGEIPEEMLFPFSQNDFNRRKITRQVGNALSIQPAAHRVELDDERVIHYHKLLIATGAAAVKPQMPGVNLEGVIMLDTLAGTRQIIKQARRGKKAVVVGGGITALELVEGLEARGVTVHYFLRKDRYWANVLDETESSIVQHRLQAAGVHIHTYTEIAEIVGKETGWFGKGEMAVAGVRTTRGEYLPCDLVGIAIGVRPQVELGKRAGLAIDKGILVNAQMQTSQPDIYAAGDCAQLSEPGQPSAGLDILWPIAREQGRVAGANMAGEAVSYHKTVPLNVTRLAGLTTTIIGTVGVDAPDPDVLGVIRGDSDTFRQVPDAMAAQSGFDVNHIRLVLGHKSILGAVIMGDQALSKIIQQMIHEQVDISPVRDALLQPGAAIGDILIHLIEKG